MKRRGDHKKSHEKSHAESPAKLQVNPHEDLPAILQADLPPP
jgi:hypothetical protein